MLSPTSLTNRFRLVRDYRAAKPVASGVPNVLYIESTNRCNLDCVMCPRRLMTRDEVDMDLQRFVGIIDQLDPALTELLVLHSDGEPLLNDDLFDMIRVGKERGFQVMTSTNATLLNADKAARLADSGIDLLTISLDGMSSEVYEGIRRGGNFENVMRNVQRFLDIKKDGLPYVTMQMVQQKTNESQADEFLRFWRPYRKYGVVPVIKPMTEWFEEHSEIIDVYNSCDRPWFGMVVQSSGVVLPCVHDFDGKYVLGRVPEDDIHAIWNSDKMQKLRASIIRGRRTNPLCEKCNATSPRSQNLLAAVGLTALDMGTIAKVLPRVGYKRPSQY